MKRNFFLFVAITLGFAVHANAQSTKLSAPIVDEEVIFEEKEGLLAVEAEFFYKQSKTAVREWFRTSKNESPSIGRDEDEPHWKGASNNAYVEILPDERVTHSDELVRGDNFSNVPGEIAVLHYKVKFNNPGRYFVWVRAFSTGSEDNGLHVGLNNEWPENGQRLQWCDGKNQWTWESKQRTKEVHCGVPHQIYLDIENAGVHEVQFSMREDGFEFDKFVLTKDIDFVPSDNGPDMLPAQGKLPAPFPGDEALIQKSYFNNIAASDLGNKVIASQQFPVDGTNFYKNGKNWLAINPEEHKEAQTSTTFNFESGNYDIIFVGVGENDGSSKFQVLINDKELGSYGPPLTNVLWKEGEPFNAFWENVNVNQGDKITVKAKVDTDGNEWTRARWAGIIFTPAGKGKEIQKAPSTDFFVK